MCPMNWVLSPSIVFFNKLTGISGLEGFSHMWFVTRIHPFIFFFKKSIYFAFPGLNLSSYKTGKKLVRFNIDHGSSHELTRLM